MSSTRRAADDSIYHPERHASSPDYETGLIASQVARRCSVLKDKADRALIWWLHFMSWESGGLEFVAQTLLSRYGDQMGTEQMVSIGKKSGESYNAEEVEIIRSALPLTLRNRFPLRGEIPREFKHDINQMRISLRSREFADEMELSTVDEFYHVDNIKIAKKQSLANTLADKQPDSYPVEDFLTLCREVATGSIADVGSEKSRFETLVKLLRDLCFNPGVRPHSDQPWFFSKLDHALQSCMEDWIAERCDGVIVTALGREVHEMLDYTLHSRTMNLLEGDARTGKSFSARTWCEQHPGHARFIEVPVGNADADFFRAFARGLGIGNFSQYKAGEIKERVESVLLTGDILVCLDEAQRLWPEMNARYGVPKRVNWLMSMVNKRVPFCLLSTPQFLERQNAWERNAGWNSAQFIGRLGLSKRLPGCLTLEDLMSVGSSIFPQVESKTIRILSAYARKSASYLAAFDRIGGRARHIADLAGRSQVNDADVIKAMEESVIPSDSTLVLTLEQGKKLKANRGAPAPPLSSQHSRLPSRSTTPDTGNFHRNNSPANDLIKG